MMLLVSLAVLSLVFPARAEVPALITGTWRMTGTPRGDGDFLHDEFTQHANGSYTGKGWGTWSEDLTSGTNNYTYSGITSDAVCETDASTGAVTHRSKWTLVEDWDLGANPMPDWNTPAGQKYVFCAYNTYDDATDIMTVTNYRGNETIALSVDPGACPATAQEAATKGLSWAARTYDAGSLTYECVADCVPWACDAADAEDAAASPSTDAADAAASPSTDAADAAASPSLVLVDDDESAACMRGRTNTRVRITLLVAALGTLGLYKA